MNEYRDIKDYNEEKEDDVHYFCRFTFGQFFTILVLEVVTLAFVFYLGAKYGTNYLKIDMGEAETPQVTEIVAGTPGTYQPSIPSSPQMNDPELQAMAKDVVSGGNSGDLKERVKELLQKEQPGAVEQQPSLVRPDAVSQAAPSAPAETPVQTQAQILEQLQKLNAEKLTPPKTAEQEQREAGLPKTTVNTESKDAESGVIRVKSAANSQYSIQVGSYPNMTEANSKVEDWRTRGYPSFMMIADIPDRGRWYRVRIGGFATKEDAQAYLQKIKTNEGADGIVVLNEQ